MPLCLLQGLQHDTASMFKPLDSSQTARHWGRARVQQDGQSRRLRELGLFSPDDGHLQGLPEQPGPACGEGIQETEPGL